MWKISETKSGGILNMISTWTGTPMIHVKQLTWNTPENVLQ